MQLASSSAYANSSAAFVSQLRPRLGDWEARLAVLLPLAGAILFLPARSGGCAAEPGPGRSRHTATRDDVINRLATCRQQTPPQTTAASVCDLGYFGLDPAITLLIDDPPLHVRACAEQIVEGLAVEW
jgi:hypothetical protein